MSALDALFGVLLGSPESFEKEVVEKVRILQDKESNSEEQEAILNCGCIACMAARQFLQHMAIVGTAYQTSSKCPCHNCVSTYLVGEETKIPSPKCPCEVCTTILKALEKPKGSGPSQMLTALLEILDAVVDSQESSSLLPSIKKEKPPFILTAAEVGEKDIIDRIKKTTPALSKPNQEIPQVNNKKDSDLIKNREKQDIGGKEPPKFETKGTTIIKPEGMAWKELAEWSLMRDKEEETVVSVNETINGFPLDAAIALRKALDEKFGFVMDEGVPTFFGMAPPETISVAIGVNEFTRVPWGMIKMPGIENGYIMPCAGHPAKDGSQVLTIHGEVKKKDRQLIADICQRAREILRTSSIYKGKAIKVSFPEDAPEHGGAFDTQDMPEFYDTSKVDPSEVVFSKAVETQIRVSLFTPIEFTEACRDAKIPLKRTVLFSGPYGVGKTLTAAVTAQKAPQHGWTFILIKSAEDLARAVEFAKQYEPAVIFAEDIDSVVKGERTIDMDGILNIVDGIESKGRDLMIVLTTNHPERINKAMLRPGRVDSYIEVLPPDAEAAARLVRVYARDRLASTEDITEVGRKLDGHKPASIREVVEKAKLASISNNPGVKDPPVSARDLNDAIDTMKPHFALMEENKEVKKTTIEDLIVTAVRKSQDIDAPSSSSNGHHANA